MPLSSLTSSPLNHTQVGDEVKAMVIILDKERGRINLSTKVLEKEPGEMMEDRQRVYDEAEARAAAVKEAREVQWHTVWT
jgi:small subunit ribosomal protein S1